MTTNAAELRERTARLAFAHERECHSRWPAIGAIAGPLDLTRETPRVVDSSSMRASTLQQGCTSQSALISVP